jgi:hypothetical protein
MILISHRGNLNGPNPQKENHPDYIASALQKVSSVEIDVWYRNSKWFLGHDEPQYEVEREFFYNTSLWCHAKNIEALYQLATLGVHYFWHEQDEVSVTSRGYFWTFPGKQLTTKSIAVMPEIAVSENIETCAGVCSDYPLEWRIKK